LAPIRSFFFSAGYNHGMLNSTVVGRTNVTKDLIILQVRPDAGVPDFLPGQYVALGLPGSAARYEGAPDEPVAPAADKLIKRAYSIGSSPAVKDYLEFYIAVVPDGSLTSRLAVLKAGDRVFAQPKVTGTFTLEGVPDEHSLVLISTGTGLAPFMSMVRTPQTWTSGRKITVVHGVRYPEDLSYADELLSYQNDRGPLFSYLPIASRAPEAYSGRKGRVQVLFDEGHLALNAATDHVYLCGNPAMIESLEKQLVDNGFSLHSKKAAGNLHVEKYW
jgi:ferredoxin--NADP+ reductase